MGKSQIPNTKSGKTRKEMSYTIELHPEAIEELKDSYQWYEERVDGLGIKFIASVNKQLNVIAAHPERYPKKKGNYRETRIDIFPYIVIYEVLKTKKVIFVSYIFHAKRNPKLKYKR
jgi:mRNA-degrading endonuclease RelE of RelBE toxin-antitoxin system